MSDELQIVEKAHCPVCATELEEVIVTCPSCDTPHHRDCWNYLGGCAVFGCDKARHNTMDLAHFNTHRSLLLENLWWRLAATRSLGITALAFIFTILALLMNVLVVLPAGLTISTVALSTVIIYRFCSGVFGLSLLCYGVCSFAVFLKSRKLSPLLLEAQQVSKNERLKFAAKLEPGFWEGTIVGLIDVSGLLLLLLPFVFLLVTTGTLSMSALALHGGKFFGFLLFLQPVLLLLHAVKKQIRGNSRYLQCMKNRLLSDRAGKKDGK